MPRVGPNKTAGWRVMLYFSMDEASARVGAQQAAAAADARQLLIPKHQHQEITISITINSVTVTFTVRYLTVTFTVRYQRPGGGYATKDRVNFVTIIV